MPSDFDHLTPDVVLNLVEATLGVRCSNICRPLNSYINRVYDVACEDAPAVIVKFYRPGRWSREALLDEHTFLRELAESEIPVIAPLADAEGRTLFEADGTRFAVFPKKGGRVCDEPSKAEWQQLGRLLARVHVVGSQHAPRDRIRLAPDCASRDQLAYIVEAGALPDDMRGAYADIAGETLRSVAPLFADIEAIRIHGDCHSQNIIDRPGESFFIIDFDDMAVGPPVQDFWMLLPGRVQDAVVELDAFLEGYETFRRFDAAELRLIEPLRAMRYIHYEAWCVRQVADGGFNRLAPGWGSREYWQRQVSELRKQQREIADALAAPSLF